MLRPVVSVASALVCGALLLLASLAPAAAEDPSVRREFYRDLHARQETQSGTESVLLVSGLIGPGSYREFHAVLARTKPLYVVLDGPGGILGEALLIGEEVRRRGLTTMVRAHHSCASACAVVFLSGRKKYLGAGAVVGLHSASNIDGRADPDATQLMASYLRGVGVPTATLKRMARTAPSDIRWLSKAEQKAMGILPYRGAQ